MMPKSKIIREKARISLQRDLFSGVWMTLILCGMIASAIISIPSSFSGLSYTHAAVAALVGVPGIVASILLGGPFSYALARMYHKVALGEKVRIPDVFLGFKENFAGSLVLALMRSLFIWLWSLLFIIPGIVKSYAYSMAFFIQQESNGEKNWRTCLDESKELTYGYKGKLFGLDLSFIGWYIVGYLCFGVGALWVTAYHQEARAHFYEELKKIKYGSTAEAVDPDAVITPASADSEKEHEEEKPVLEGEVYEFNDTTATGDTAAETDKKE